MTSPQSFSQDCFHKLPWSNSIKISWICFSCLLWPHCISLVVIITRQRWVMMAHFNLPSHTLSQNPENIFYGNQIRTFVCRVDALFCFLVRLVPQIPTTRQPRLEISLMISHVLQLLNGCRKFGVHFNTVRVSEFAAGGEVSRKLKCQYRANGQCSASASTQGKHFTLPKCEPWSPRVKCTTGLWSVRLWRPFVPPLCAIHQSGSQWWGIDRHCHGNDWAPEKV